MYFNIEEQIQTSQHPQGCVLICLDSSGWFTDNSPSDT